MKPLITLFFLLLSILSGGQINSVYFEIDSHDLTKLAQSELDKFYSNFLKINEPEVVIKGYADSTGGVQHNLELSKNRVESVQRYLINKGYAKNRILLEYFGEEEGQDSILESNRRVDLFVNPSFTVYDYLNKKEPQKFIIDNSKDNTVVGEEGTFIFIPANCFDLGEGQKDSDVQIELSEYISMQDILSSKLTTITEDGKFLETAGMIYLSAEINGEAIKLKDKAKIMVGIPNETPDQDMMLYSGTDVGKKIIWESDASSKPIENGKIEAMHGHRRAFALDQLTLYNSDYKDHLKENLIYPLSSIQNGECGVVEARFKVNSKGKIVDVVVTKELTPDLDRAVVEALNSCPAIPPIYEKEKRAMKHYFTGYYKFYLPRCRRNSSKNAPNSKNLITDENFKKYSADEISRMVFLSEKLGWLNVDKLKSLSNDRVRMEIEIVPLYNLDVKMLLDDKKAVVPGIPGNKMFVFKKVPNCMKATIIGIRYDDQKIYLAKMPLTIEKRTISELQFKEVSVSELLEELKR